MYDWDRMYESGAPWEVSHPQQSFVRLFEDGELQPYKLLDIGCGTGENAILFALEHFEVTGIDSSAEAIGMAKERARHKHACVKFLEGDVRELRAYFRDGYFDAAIDSGLYHVLEEQDGPAYVSQVCHILRPGGTFFMQCFSDKETYERGPRKITKEEIIRVFSPLFKIEYIRDSYFEARVRKEGMKAYMVKAIKVDEHRSAASYSD